MTSAAILLLTAFVPAQSDSSPLARTDVFSADTQWKAIEASPRIHSRTGDHSNGSSVVVAIKDDFAFVLTAAHVVKVGTIIEADFFVRSSYPARDYSYTGLTLVERNATADIALLKIPIDYDDPPPTLPLAPPGHRSKTFPFPALSVGCDDGFSARCQEDEVLAKRLIRRPESKVAFFWETRLQSRPGRSGGPLIDKDGFVFGLCAANQGGYGYFVYTDEIHAWLKPLGYDWLWSKPAGK